MLPHKIIKEKLTELIEVSKGAKIRNRYNQVPEQILYREGSLYCACNEKHAFLLLNNLMKTVVVMSENV